MRGVRRRSARALAAALALLAATTSAQDDPLRALLRQGEALQRLGANEEALAVFARAHALCHCDEAMVSRAATEQALGRWVDAAEHLAAVDPSSPDPWVQQRRVRIDRARAFVAERVGWLDLAVSPPEARVSVAGRAAGDARRVRVARGDVTVRVEAAGYVAEERVVRVESAEGARAEVSLAREVTAVTVAPIPREPAASAAVAPRRSYRGWMWGSVAVAGLALAGAGVAWWAREESVARYNDPGCVTVFASRDERCGAYREAAATDESLAIAGAVVGGVAGVAAAVLAVIDARGARGERAWRCASTGAGATCEARF